MADRSDAVFWRRCAAVLALSALALVVVGRYTNLDLFLADALYDTAAGGFPLRDDWFMTNVMHNFMKALMLGVGLVPATTVLADLVFRRRLLTPRSRIRWYAMLAASILIPAAIALIKSKSIHACPWDLQRYGGNEPYLRIFDLLPAGVTAGHCFPAGHASGGLWLAVACVFWLPGRPRKALAMFGVFMLPGLVLGVAQQLRGAHFMTHTLWSMWIAAAITLALAWLVNRAQLRLSERVRGLDDQEVDPAVGLADAAVGEVLQLEREVPAVRRDHADGEVVAELEVRREPVVVVVVQPGQIVEADAAFGIEAAAIVAPVA
jgi:membrane-associated PAP2 superfamily phosphatase